jgi:hypothetical protein
VLSEARARNPGLRATRKLNGNSAQRVRPSGRARPVHFVGAVSIVGGMVRPSALASEQFCTDLLLKLILSLKASRCLRLSLALCAVSTLAVSPTARIGSTLHDARDTYGPAAYGLSESFPRNGDLPESPLSSLAAMIPSLTQIVRYYSISIGALGHGHIFNNTWRDNCKRHCRLLIRY